MIASVLVFVALLGAPVSPIYSPAADDMNVAMERMHRDMMRPTTGDPDRDFAEMMIAHHEGAIEMAKVQLRHGKDEQLRRLAQGIIVEQQQEIATMKRVLAERAVRH